MNDQNTQWRYSIHNRDQAPGANHESQQANAGQNAEDGAMDAVVVALLGRGDVTPRQVNLAKSHAAPGKELWRILLRVEGVSRDAVFAEAAEQAGYESFEVNAWEPPDDLVQSIFSLFGPETVQLLLRAGLFPVEVLADEAVDDFTLSFATHDPTSQAARQIAASLGVGTKFSFAPESVIQARISGLGHSCSTPAQDIVEAAPKQVSQPLGEAEPDRPAEPRHSTPDPESNNATSRITDSSDGAEDSAPTSESVPAAVEASQIDSGASPETGSDSNGSLNQAFAPKADVPTIEEQPGGGPTPAIESVVSAPPVTPVVSTPPATPVVSAPPATPENSELEDATAATMQPGISPHPPQKAESLAGESTPGFTGQRTDDQSAAPAQPSTESVEDCPVQQLDALAESVEAILAGKLSPKEPAAERDSSGSVKDGSDSAMDSVVESVVDSDRDSAVDSAQDSSVDPMADFANPYVEFIEDENGAEVLVEDVFADLSSAITILDPEDELASGESVEVEPTAETSESTVSTAQPTEEATASETSASQQEASSAEVDAAPESESESGTTTPEKAPEIPRDRVVVMLLHKQAVTKESVAESVRIQREEQPKEALWRLLASVPGVDRDAVYAEAASVYAFPMADISDPDPNFARLVMETFSEERREMLLSMGLLPLEYDMDTASGSAKLVFATHDPARPDVHRVLQQLKLGRFELKYAPESEIKRITHDIFPRRNEFLDRMTDDPMAMDLGTEFDSDKGDTIDEEALEAEISRSTLINLFEATLVEATRSGASDIHIFPNPNRKVEIHFRSDGRLQRWHTEDKVHPEAFLAVVKDNSVNVDRFERDAAQDGFIQRRIDDALIRFRVSVLPIATASQEIRAESIVIRVLDDRKVLTDLRKLGMLEVALERFDRAIRQPHGMVILTGPTGSGKSTTLVAALHQVVTPEVNVLTVEDPVEYIIKGVRQIKLSNKLNLEQALRSILRHDPDVVMVGEMRDQQTAELAIKLANTGHLTFSTLHTNDAPSAVSRLYKMGIEPFLLAYAINLVVAQRLLRNLCPTCKVVDEDPDTILMESVGFTKEEIETLTFYAASHDRSCRTCKGTGYKGRRAMCETLYFSRDIRHMIVQSGKAIDEDAIRKLAVEEGMLTLLDSAREIVKMGDTSFEELIRVTSSD